MILWNLHHISLLEESKLKIKTQQVLIFNTFIFIYSLIPGSDQPKIH